MRFISVTGLVTIIAAAPIQLGTYQYEYSYGPSYEYSYESKYPSYVGYYDSIFQRGLDIVTYLGFNSSSHEQNVEYTYDNEYGSGFNYVDYNSPHVTYEDTYTRFEELYYNMDYVMKELYRGYQQKAKAVSDAFTFQSQILYALQKQKALTITLETYAPICPTAAIEYLQNALDDVWINVECENALIDDFFVTTCTLGTRVGYQACEELRATLNPEVMSDTFETQVYNVIITCP